MATQWDNNRGGLGFEPPEFLKAWRRYLEVLKAKTRLAVLGLVGLVAVWTSYYQVEPEEVAVVTRFGGYLHTTPPGPHFKLPFGMDRVYKVPVQRQLKEEFGFRTLYPDVRSQTAVTEESRRESQMLTGDLNVATVEWIVQYQVRDPFKYLFRVRNVTDSFRDMSEAVMRQVIGDRGVTEVLTVGREKIQIAAKQELQQLCDRYQTGIKVLQLVLKDVNPPDAVRASFNEVNQAIQERERLINQARAEYNRIVPETRGKAAQELQSAEGYAAERINRARGDAERFIALQREYAKAPKVTRTRLYLETVAATMPQAQRRLLVDPELKGLLPVLPLQSRGPGDVVAQAVGSPPSGAR